MDTLLSELFNKFGGVFLEGRETISGSFREYFEAFWRYLKTYMGRINAYLNRFGGLALRHEGALQPTGNALERGRTLVCCRHV